jgi:hypothetical protein
MSRGLAVGEQVKFGLSYDLDDQDRIARGEKGKIVALSNGMVGVRLAREHPALAHVENTFALDPDDAKHLRRLGAVIKRVGLAAAMAGFWLLPGPLEVSMTADAASTCVPSVDVSRWFVRAGSY